MPRRWVAFRARHLNEAMSPTFIRRVADQRLVAELSATAAVASGALPIS
jgi:hypothetical protein